MHQCMKFNLTVRHSLFYSTKIKPNTCTQNVLKLKVFSCILVTIHSLSWLYLLYTGKYQYKLITSHKISSSQKSARRLFCIWINLFQVRNKSIQKAEELVLYMTTRAVWLKKLMTHVCKCFTVWNCSF